MDKKTLIPILIASIVALGLGYWLVVQPRLALKELAQDTCAELDGSVMFQIMPIMKRAESRAERLRFGKDDLLAKMEEICPSTLRAIREWAERSQERRNAR